MDLPEFHGSMTLQNIRSPVRILIIGDRIKALQALVTYAEAQKVVPEVKIVSIIIHCTHDLSSHWLRAYSYVWKSAQPTDLGLSLTIIGDWGFPLVTMNVAPGYFHMMIKEK